VSRMYRILFAIALGLCASNVDAAGLGTALGLNITSAGAGNEEVVSGIKILLGLTVLSIAPAILIMMTSFTRIIIVLSLLRHAMGTQETPPNTVLLSLALFLTAFNMMPTMQKANEQGFQPFVQGSIGFEVAIDRMMLPLRGFMIRQTREEDLALMIEVAHGKRPKTMDDVSSVHLIPAFMLSELKTAFQIGFVIFLPFLLIDILVASILMSMGMLMVPPLMISLPLKILMFVLIDGWSLIVKALLGSFHEKVRSDALWKLPDHTI